MTQPQTIQIFLPSGDPKGIKIAELTMRMIKAVLVPRDRLKDSFNRDEMKSSGVYFLFGEDPERAKDLLYIGETEDCVERLKIHNSEKEFWTHVVVFVRKDVPFTKTEVKYIEHKAVEVAQDIGKYELINSTKPKRTKISEALKADMDYALETIDLLMTTLGYSALEQVVEPEGTAQEIWSILTKESESQGVYVNGGITILKGSKARVKETKSLSESTKKLRSKLINEAVIQLVNGHYVFLQDFQCKTPSMASDLILGRSSNGWTEWRNKVGVTLNKSIRE